FTAVIDEAVAEEHRVDRADRRGLNLVVRAAQPFADLGRTPTWPLTLELNDQLLDLEGQPIGVPVRSAAAVGESVEPPVLVALEDLVAGLARDIEVATDGGHLLAVEQAGDEPEPLIHLGTLLPRHFALPAKCRSVTYVPGIYCYPSLRKDTPGLRRIGID